MNNVYKGKAKLISASMVAALIALVTLVNAGKLHHSNEFYKTLTSDTIPAGKKNNKIISPGIKPAPSSKQIPVLPIDTIPVPDSLKHLIDTSGKLRQIIDTTGKEQALADTGIIQKLQVDTFDIKISKDTLSAPVYYHADDSVVVDVPGNKIMLYGKTTTA